MSVTDHTIAWISELATILVEAGYARCVATITAIADDVSGDQTVDLLPVLVEDWQASSTEGTVIAEWLDQQLRRGASLTVGYASGHEAAVREWLGVRLAWWPGGIPSGRRIGVASSRLGRQLDQQQAWLDAFRTACGKIDRQCETLVAARDTAAAPLVRRAAELFELPLLTIETPLNDSDSVGTWLDDLTQKAAQRPNSTRDDSIREVRLSPLLPSGLVVEPAVGVRCPNRDRAVAALSDRLFVFHLRSKGHWHQLVRERLNSVSFPPASVYVAMGRQMIAPKSAAQLLDVGAVGWVVPQTLSVEPTPGAVSTRTKTETVPSDLLPGRPAIITVPTDEPWKYLTHCTRRCEGAWPGQAENEYLEQLLMHSEEADRSALAALLRIIETRKLGASATGIRGKSAVVCLTAVPLHQLEAMRTFRPHRHRWDFEPYGICIHRDWLQSRGARPVHYGNQQLWEFLPEHDRPFFQVSHSTGGRQVVDWTAEQEWRHAGNITLDHLPSDAAFVFVATEDEAKRVAARSPWPVAVVGEAGLAEQTAQKPR